MSSDIPRLELSIDVLNVAEAAGQRALVQANLKPLQLVEAILNEFQSIDHLSSDPSAYQLRRLNNGQILDDALELREQVVPVGERLALFEKEQPLPEGTRRPSSAIYLREQETGKVFKLHWLPAIVGRFDLAQPQNEWIAVDLQFHPQGLRVSRRHALITEKEGRLFVESLSKNGTRIRHDDGETTSVSPAPQPLRAGDSIVLERSGIVLELLTPGMPVVAGM